MKRNEFTEKYYRTVKAIRIQSVRFVSMANPPR